MCCDQPTLKNIQYKLLLLTCGLSVYLAVLSQEKRLLVFRSDTNKNISEGKKPWILGYSKQISLKNFYTAKGKKAGKQEQKKERKIFIIVIAVTS